MLTIPDLLAALAGGTAEHLASEFIAERVKNGTAKLSSYVIKNYRNTWRIGRFTFTKTKHDTETTFTFKD